MMQVLVKHSLCSRTNSGVAGVKTTLSLQNTSSVTVLRRQKSIRIVFLIPLRGSSKICLVPLKFYTADQLFLTAGASAQVVRALLFPNCLQSQQEPRLGQSYLASR